MSYKFLFVSLVEVLREAIQFWPLVCMEFQLVLLQILCRFHWPVCSGCLGLLASVLVGCVSLETRACLPGLLSDGSAHSGS